MVSEPLMKLSDDSTWPRPVLWNDAPFESVLPIRRSTHIVRTKAVAPHMRRKYAREGWPRDLVLLREFKLKLIGEEVTLAIVTNAPEAECEVPDKIVTAARNTGTFHGATLFWQGRKEEAFVSARVTAERDQKAIAALEPIEQVTEVKSAANEQMASLAMAQRTLQSGLLIPATASLPAQMTPEERELANLLLTYKEPDKRRVYSLAEIGKRFRCSDEAIRRRMAKLFASYPTLKAPVASIRACNCKGIHPAAIAPQG